MKGTLGRNAGRGKFSSDRSGAAEIIGDILLVSMSVMMVSLLALQLSSVQNPADATRADLGASYDGQNVTVLHMGGDRLDNSSTRFYLFINDSLTVRANITDGKTGTSWRMGENWTLPFATGATQRVRIEVIDTKNNAVILDQELQRGPEAALLPDLGLASNDIAVFYNGRTFNDTGNPMTGDTVVINATLHNWGTAPAYNFTVRMSVYSTIDRRTYAVASFQKSLNAGQTDMISANYTVPGGSWGMNSVSVRVVPLLNETKFGNNYAVNDFRVGYYVIASHPGNPVLRIRTIESLPKYPTHGAYVNLTARISNQGGVPANATVKYFLNSVAAPNQIAVDSPVGVPVGGESLSTVVWKTPRGGVQTIIVNVTDPTGTTDQQSIQVEVMPTILLVDDDRAGEGGLKDVVSSMRVALGSAAASYTTHEVPGNGDGPLYESGDHPLKDYDLVIWMTGYENSNTLTNRDQTELTKYLNNKGCLWLIGQDILSALGRNNNFLKTVMMVDSSMPVAYYNVGVPTSKTLIGMNIMNRTLIQMNRPFVPGGLSDRTDAMLPSAKGVSAFSEHLGAGRSMGILFNATTNGTPGDETYKAAFFGFEPSQIASVDDRAIVTYEVLRWFGIYSSWGRDLAVSNQRFSHATPAFMEEVNITATVRNNGLSDEPVDTSRPQLQVGFFVDGSTFIPQQVTIDLNGSLTIFYPPTSEFWIPQDTTNASLEISGSGGIIKVSAVWTADRIGSHTVVARVDPYDYIQEISETNNEVSSVASKTVYVRYGTLVVDDDESANNAAGHYNATQNLTAALDLLGYQYDIVVNHQNDDGPALSKMELYNAIIWCTGEEATPFTGTDKTSLAQYLNKGDGRNLWVIGPRAAPDGRYGDGDDAFFRDLLRVSRVSDPNIIDAGLARTPAYIEGANLDPMTHGMRYSSSPAFTDAGRLLVPYIDGRGMTYQNPMPSISTPNEMVYCDAQDGTVAGWYKRIEQVTTTSSISNIYDSSRDSRVMELARAGTNPASPNYFILGDYNLTQNWNPNSLAWLETQRFTAQWSFKSSMDIAFVWHVTDTAGAHHTLTYTNQNSNNLAAEPVRHGMGAWVCDGQWHTATRDLLRDLREGAGNGALRIREVDGFEVAIRTGTVWVDDISLSRPFNAVRYYNATGNFKTVFSGWDQSSISFDGNNDSNAELAYMVLSWFNMYDDRTELRTTHLDLFFGNMTPLRDMKPMIGESYMLKARVWNLGGTRGDAVIRFSDGNTVIDSVSVSIEHEAYILAEIIWTPIFAGNRTLSVSVDPDGVLSEIFKSNNGASIPLQVFFFYDDMEYGPYKWKHESTIVRLNGESSLEYMDPGPVSSNVVGQWGQFNGFRNNTDNASATCITSIFHTQSRSVYMHEPKLSIRSPADVVIVIDRSGSMGGQKITDARNAAAYFVDCLNVTMDRVSVWSYSWYTSTPRMNLGFTTNFALAKTTIQGLNAGGNTAGYTAMGESSQYCIDNARGNAVRAVVFLTDGQFNEDLGFYQEATTLAVVANLGGPLFTIGLGADVDAVRLTNCAAASQGGKYYFSPTSAQLQGIYQQIAAVIESLAQPIGRSAAEGAAGGRSDVTIFTDDFETDKGWTVTNMAGTFLWVRTNRDKNAGARAYRMAQDDADGGYANGEVDYLTSPRIDLSGNYSAARISFWSRERVETGYDFCSLYVSNDDGANWSVLWSRAADNHNFVWVSNLDIATVVPLTNQMRIRFTFTSDTSVTDVGWTIDDFVLNATRAAPQPPPPKPPVLWLDGNETPSDKSITTGTFSLENVTSARLTFWHRYNLKLGSNGGVLMVGNATSAGGPYTYRYISPTQPYNGNLKIAEWGTAHLKDGFGNDMKWCWNGMSGAGKFTWDYIEADLTQFCGLQFVRVRFQYLYCDGGTGYGWALDDIEIKVSRSNAVNVTANSSDQWELVQEGQTYGDDYADARFAYSGRYSWWNHDPQVGTDSLKGGMDTSLISVPIDLGRAKDATLVAKLRFNVPFLEGRPPDGFRVEVSSNNGITWRQINMGIRSGWNISGTDAAGPGGTSYTGVDIGDNWVLSNSLTRLNCDLSGWAGSVILLRFRIVTRNDTAQHYDDLSPGFAGFFLDDVTVVGNTTTGQGRGTEADGSRQMADGNDGGSGQMADGTDACGRREPADGSRDGSRQTAVGNDDCGSGQMADGSRDGNGQLGDGTDEHAKEPIPNCQLPFPIPTANCQLPSASVIPSRRPTE